MKWVNRLISNINNQQEKNNEKIKEKQAKLDAGGLKASKVKSLNKKIKKLNASNKRLEGVRGEIATLEASDQGYDVTESSSMSTNSLHGGGSDFAHTSFNYSTKAIDITLSSSASIELFAHELKHA